MLTEKYIREQKKGCGIYIGMDPASADISTLNTEYVQDAHYISEITKTTTEYSFDIRHLFDT